ncbi:MAG: hypothetical protein ACP5N2_05655 [Candidatus Nanoarchaeia archaeon]
MRKGQFALEFVILVSFTILFTAVFLVVIQGNYMRNQQLKQEQQVMQIMRIINSEVDLAQMSPSGYTRTFYIPNSIEGVPYSLKSNDGVDVVFDYYGKTYVFFLNNGTLRNANIFLKPGYNKIRKDCSFQNSACRVELVSS